jgi:enoyl-CoA hydratase/carnithine racemase
MDLPLSEASMSYEFVRYEKRDHIAILTLNRPDRLNALGRQISQEINQVLAEFAGDEDAWVLIYTGTGRAFSAGADLKEAAERAQRNEVDLGGPAPSAPTWKPTIAAINGIAMGGGFERAMRCDIRICASNARFSLPEVMRSLLPGTASWKMQRLTFPGIALHYILTGEEFGAEEAYRLGLVSRVVEPERLMDEALAIAQRLCDNAPLAVRMCKKIWYQGADMAADLAASYAMDLSLRLRMSEDAREGPRAFVEKRKPQWKGR